MPCGSPGSKSHRFLIPDTLEVHLSGAVPRIGMPDVGHKCFASQGQAPQYEIPPHCGEWDFLQEHVSALSTCLNIAHFPFVAEVLFS